jgi:Ser/Thr protein kinase RdoA (MazF antagonist)
MDATFPVGPRAVVSFGLLQALQCQYPLGAIEAWADLGGAYNLNLALHTSRGTSVARIYRPWVTPQRLQAIQVIKQGLAAHAIPVVLPIPTSAGDPLLVHEQRVVEVEPFLPGSGAAESWPAYEAAFAVLGQLHGVLAAYARPHALPPPRVEHYGLPMTLLDWVARTRRCIQQARPGAGDAAVQVCDDATQILTCLHRWWNERGRYLPRHLVHGDYGL